MQNIVFPSVLFADKIAYCLGDELPWSRNGLIVHHRAGMFDTYGDGMVQHSPAYHIGPERFEDWCLSLATYLLANIGPLAERDTQHAPAWYWFPDTNAATVEFLASLRHDKEKRRFYSFAERKLTTRESARYDKRYAEVPEWADGKVKNIVALFVEGLGFEPGILHRAQVWYMARRAKDAWNDGEKLGDVIAGIGSEWDDAYLALDCALKALNCLDATRRALECAKHNIANRSKAAQAA